MDLKFSELIRRIESEISFEYLPQAIHWCDKNYDGAWSQAIDRFDRALGHAMDRMDWTLATTEAGHYRATLLDLIAKFKQSRNLDEMQIFLSAIQKEKP